MPTDSETLATIANRQLTTIAMIGQVLDVVEIHRDMQQVIHDQLEKLEAWLREPPKSDLAATLRDIAEKIATQTEMLQSLPAAVAREVAKARP
jgi:hypothetical protein